MVAWRNRAVAVGMREGEGLMCERRRKHMHQADVTAILDSCKGFVSREIPREPSGPPSRLRHVPTLTTRSPQPTPAHYFIRLLHDHGLLRRCFTQNIDTLESLAGLPDSHLIEAHGSFANAHCLSCQREAGREYVLAAGVREGKVVRCDEKGCGGLVKPDIVFFGEGLPERFFRSIGVSRGCGKRSGQGTRTPVHLQVAGGELAADAGRI
jgi:hypothetical protein